MLDFKYNTKKITYKLDDQAKKFKSSEIHLLDENRKK